MTTDLQESPTTFKLDTIEDAIADIKAGKVIIVVDDEDRENEGDFVCAAETVTPATINFMATHGRGLICSPVTRERAKLLGLTPMVQQNTDIHGTAFTVSIDYRLKGCTTGISAYDRATGIKALTDPDTQASDYARPGHIFPLIAKPGGVLRRTGHTEATIDLAKLAGFSPAGVLVEILNEDGTMARLPQLMEIAKKHDLKIISIEDLVSWRMQRERLVKRETSVEIDTMFGKCELIAFTDITNNAAHLAVKMGTWEADEPVLTRVHSSNYSGEIVATLLKSSSGKMQKAMSIIQEAGKGVLLILLQKEEENALINTIKSMQAQKEKGLDIKPFPLRNQETLHKELGVGAQILRELGIQNIKLITNNPQLKVPVSGYGLEVVEYVGL
ncbi:MAG: 3,4-dihydroxy 2-butanone 4-phosphate synthase/GTP cyclohydrolase II [Paraglaciecola sp.]|jgi:3,4-dihydroxy 2-butanone 4-phosphate synthase/GTP cyclohydrolase II